MDKHPKGTSSIDSCFYAGIYFYSISEINRIFIHKLLLDFYLNLTNPKVRTPVPARDLAYRLCTIEVKIDNYLSNSQTQLFTITTLYKMSRNESFLKQIVKIRKIVSKVLSLTMALIILLVVIDLITFLIRDLISHPIARFSLSFLEILGILLNILIALEIMRNITVYLQKQAVQVKLVIATSLIAVSRKIIIYDLENLSGSNLIGLAVAIFTLSASYGIIRQVGAK